MLFGIAREHERFAVLGSASHSLWAYVRFRSELAHASFFGAEPASRAPRTLHEELAAYGPSVLYAVPDLLASLIKAQPMCLPTVRLLILGGGPWPPGLGDLLDFFAPKATVHLFYGTAETSFIAHSSPLEWPWYRPFPDVALRIDSSTGQLWIRSPLTAMEADEWVATSDVVGLTDEEGPRLRLIGRMERRIRIRGVDVVPERLERFISERWPNLDLAVVEMACPKGRPRLGLFYNGPDCLRSSQAQLREQLRAAFPSVPPLWGFFRLPEWPRLGSGKTDFVALAALVSQRVSD
jgi:long-chain acyl-CoA synthetase